MMMLLVRQSLPSELYFKERESTDLQSAFDQLLGSSSSYYYYLWVNI